MLKKLIRQAKTLKTPSALFVNHPNGYDFDLPDNILVFARGGLSPVLGQGAHSPPASAEPESRRSLPAASGRRRFLLETGSVFLIYPYENHLFMHTDEQIFRLMITFEVKRSDILPERHSSAMLNPESFTLVSNLLKAYQNQRGDGTRHCS